MGAFLGRILARFRGNTSMGFAVAQPQRKVAARRVSPEWRTEKTARFARIQLVRD